MAKEINILRSEKIGRNEPCPCGSGKKYKRCCLADQDTQPMHNFNPVQFKLEMEKMMRQMSKIAETKEMSMEEMNRFMVGKKMEDIDAEYQTLGGLSPKEQAQDLVWKAWETTGKKQIKLAEEALALYPNLPDAYLILADEKATNIEQALDYLKKAVEAGEKDLGEAFFKENEGHFWGMTETRGYMRAKANLAEVLWGLGKQEEALIHYEQCLKLNPSDNQGLRYTLLSWLLELGRLDEVESIFKRYKDDGGAMWEYSKALFNFRKHGGESLKAKRQLEKAISVNGFVPGYLLGKKRMPEFIPDSYSPESPEEATIYADDAYEAWDATPGSLDWLAENQ
jgi:tetratricopeptide (TPR) repeat protein